MRKNARTGLCCGPMLALALVAVGCGGEPIDQEGDEAVEATVDGIVNLEDAERGTIVGVAEDVASSEEAVAEAQAAAKPDLVPRIDPIPNPCLTSVVRWSICNIGTGAALASKATLQFDDAPPIYRSIPALAAGQCSVKNTNFLPPQPDGEVIYRVTADSAKDVVESKENNNQSGGLCVE